MHRWTQRLPHRVIVAVVLVITAVMPFIPGVASAQFTQAYIRFDRLQTSTATGGLVCATPSSASTGPVEAKVLITFPNATTPFTLNTTAANWTVSTATIPTGSVAWPGIGTATAIDNVNKIATFPSTDLTAGTQYCFTFSATNTLTTSSTAGTSEQGSIITQTSGGTQIDATNLAFATVSSDQITVSAVVPPSFSFALNSPTDTFSAVLGSGTVGTTPGDAATIITNAKGGWIVWAKDSNQGLHSVSANYTIATTGTVGTASYLTAGTEGYLMDSILTTDSTGGCTVGIAPGYDGTTTGHAATVSGGTLSSTYQQVASCPNAPTGQSTGDVITLSERAAISTVTPASNDYSDIITVVGAGNF